VDKKPLIGVSICAVVLLVLGSLSTVVGYQSVQSSNQKIINDKVDQKELLFQTILDLANNKEIQRVIFTSQMNLHYFTSGMKTLPINTPVITKKHLELAYQLGLLLLKYMTSSRVASIMRPVHDFTPGVQQRITSVVENDTKLNGEINQLSTSDCHCQEKKDFRLLHPVICIILFCIIFFELYMVGLLYLVKLTSIAGFIEFYILYPQTLATLLFCLEPYPYL
jgi:hypothetical protein